MLMLLLVVLLINSLIYVYSNDISRLSLNQGTEINRIGIRNNKKVLTNSIINKIDKSNIIALNNVNEINTGTSDINSLVFNLAKTILGAGILSLPNAVALFSDQTNVLPYASLVIVLMGIISGYTFSSIGKACRIHGVNTFHEAFILSINKSNNVVNKFMPLIITIKTFFACLAYSIIIADTFSQLVKAITNNLSSLLSDTLTTQISNRSNIIIGLTSLIIFPLCLLKNLDGLKYTSVLGLLGLVYCLVFMIIRYFDKSYTSTGEFFTSVPVIPSFNVKGIVYDQRLFVFLATVATAFVAHYNAPKINKELSNPTDSRYNRVVTLAFGFATVMYVAILFAGFYTFGGNSLGFILNNYSIKDPLALLARLTVGLSILFSYPLTFTALRDGIIDLFDLSNRVPKQLTNYLQTNLTVVLLSILTYLSTKIRNLGLVVSLSGSLIGCMLIYIIPAVMNISNLSNNKKSNKYEITLNYVIIALGSLIAIQGVKATLQLGSTSGH